MSEINDVDNNASASPVLEFRFRIEAQVAPGISIDRRAPGALDFIPITGGSVSGAVQGKLSAGGDWCADRGDGTWRVEARYGIALDGGGYIDVHNVGVFDESRPDGREYFATTPVFRTVAAEYDWLNRSVFVGRAQEFDGLICVDVYEVLLPR